MAASEQASQASMQVVVQNLAGKELALELQQTETVRQLKASVQEHWDMPLLCQQMLLGGTVLSNASTLGDYCAEIPPGGQLRVLCVYSLPHDGDVNKAALAQDREAVRLLMRERDKDKEHTHCPAQLSLLVTPWLGVWKHWPRICEALLDRGYRQEEIDAALPHMPQPYCYRDVLKHLELSRRISNDDVPSLQWWRKSV
mmetsp:Transcript_28804/g.82483  ORF Transcript_28804/g.82483 Transcript_28804/m.82483 type:complete len:199 (+) Transcript_28804:83-679(+)